MLAIGPATSADIAALRALDPLAAKGSDRHRLIGEWVAAGQCHLAIAEGRIAGYVVLTRNFFQRPFVELVMVAIRSRRSGIGTALLRHCMGLAGRELWISTNESNLPTRSLLVGLGFEPSGQVENLDPGDAELIFRWRG